MLIEFSDIKNIKIIILLIMDMDLDKFFVLH
jgi:hypothetical protein